MEVAAEGTPGKLAYEESKQMIEAEFGEQGSNPNPALYGQAIMAALKTYQQGKENREERRRQLDYAGHEEPAEAPPPHQQPSPAPAPVPRPSPMLIVGGSAAILRTGQDSPSCWNSLMPHSRSSGTRNSDPMPIDCRAMSAR